MNHYQKSQSAHSPLHQQSVRSEITRQVEEFLNRGGKIEQLAGPHCQPPRAVGINSPVITDVL